MSLASLRLHSPATAGKLNRPFDISRAACGPQLCWSEECARLENCRVRGGRGLSLVADTTFNGGAFFGTQNRKDWQTARPKCAGATERVRPPHAPGALRLATCNASPGAY